MTSAIPQLLRDQALNGAVKHYTRDVIRAAAVKVQLLKPEDRMESGMRESQLRNVVNVAIGAHSVEEVAAFILYQMGRSTNSRQWQYGKFGDGVVHDLMQGAVRMAATQAQTMALQTIVAGKTEVTSEDAADILDHAYIALARQYLGYLNRLFFFAEKTGRWEELREWNPAQPAEGGPTA